MTKMVLSGTGAVRPAAAPPGAADDEDGALWDRCGTASCCVTRSG